jgi:uncharacterized membrane protein
MTPLITNDAIVLGILMVILGFVFITAHSDVPFWKKFYTYIPPLLLCYFVPSIFSSVGLYSGDVSKLYTIASQYLLPTSLVLLTISIDLKAIARLGPKAVIMFLGGTVGIILGGPLAVLIVSFINPELVGGTGTRSSLAWSRDNCGQLDWRQCQSDCDERSVRSRRSTVFGDDCR